MRSKRSDRRPEPPNRARKPGSARATNAATLTLRRPTARPSLSSDRFLQLASFRPPQGVYGVPDAREFPVRVLVPLPQGFDVRSQPVKPGPNLPAVVNALLAQLR